MLSLFAADTHPGIPVDTDCRCHSWSKVSVRPSAAESVFLGADLVALYHT